MSTGEEPFLGSGGRERRYFNQLVEAFYRAALFLKKRVDEDGWKWSSNYLREHVRCETRMTFSNSLSPQILRELLYRHPELVRYIEIDRLKGE